ncbi:MAG: FliH/SctL family protein [Terracidiphilus sp.]|jgi:flagellar assembly protein FliH
MKNFSFDSAEHHTSPAPVAPFMYRDTGADPSTNADGTKRAQAPAGQAGQQVKPGKSAQEIDDLLNLARIEAVAETEKRLKKQYEAKSEAEAAKIRQALELFKDERKDYFSRVEAQVVHLALAIATKILHREAQVDPLLVAALVRVAVDKLHNGSSVSVRVSPNTANNWRDYLASPQNGSTIAIVEDAHLGPEDCILETDLGSADFSIDAQLKEVEQGFFDLLAQRPPVK